MVVYNRNTLQSRIADFNITIGNNDPQEPPELNPDENEYCGQSDSFNSHTRPDQERIQITCVNPIEGRYVTIRIPGSRTEREKRFLNLAEVLVYAEPSKRDLISYFVFAFTDKDFELTLFRLGVCMLGVVGGGVW